MTIVYHTRKAKQQTWLAREGSKVWQKAVYEKAERLIALHTAIEAIEANPATLVTMDIAGGGPSAIDVAVTLSRGAFLDLVRSEENDIISDLARILRQVTE